MLGIGSVSAPPSAGADIPLTRASQADRALDAVATERGDRARTAIPTAFTERFYTPVLEHGVLVNPTGDCSSPIPLPSEFDVACRAHDLGYDLLRFAGGSGTTEAARRDLDSRLGETMNASCAGRPEGEARASCSMMADIASGAVEFNSWRQHYGVPDPEPALPFLFIGITAGTLAVAASTASVLASLRVREVTA